MEQATNSIMLTINYHLNCICLCVCALWWVELIFWKKLTARLRLSDEQVKNSACDLMLAWRRSDLLVASKQVLSLTEKLQQGKEAVVEPRSKQKSDALPVDELLASDPQFNVKVEDRLSTGSGGSAVVDEDGPQLVDSGDSYFPCDDYAAGCVTPAADGVQSEEDDGSDNGQNYLSNVFVAAEQQNQEGEPVGWWVWS